VNSIWPKIRKQITHFYPKYFRTFSNQACDFKSFIKILSRTSRLCGSVTNNSTWIRIGYRIYSLWRFTTAHITITSYWHNNTQLNTRSMISLDLLLQLFWTLTSALYNSLWALYSSDSGDSLMMTHSRTGVDWLTPIPETDSFRFKRLTNSQLCITFPLQHRAVPTETFDHGC
jgi:hypothetical protein